MLIKIKMICFYIIISSFCFCEEKTNDSKYFGGWPHNDKKDKIEGSPLNYICPNSIGCDCNNNKDCINNNCIRSPKGSFCYPKNGDIFPEFISIDQYEDVVNLYDFANQGKYILIELGAVWCSPCNDLGEWFAYNDKSITSKRFWKPEYQKIYDMVHNGDIYFITILYEDENRDNASYETIYEWFDNYPDENIPILIDESKMLHSWAKPSGIPAITLLNENMEIIHFSSRGLNGAFDKLLEIVNNNEE